jgi:hypothetical protein
MKALKSAAFVLAGMFLTLLVVAGFRAPALRHGDETEIAIWAACGLALAVATILGSFRALRRTKEPRFWIPLGIGLLPFSVLGLSVVSAVLPPVCIAGGIVHSGQTMTSPHHPLAPVSKSVTAGIPPAVAGGLLPPEPDGLVSGHGTGWVRRGKICSADRFDSSLVFAPSSGVYTAGTISRPTRDDVLHRRRLHLGD